MYEMEGEKQTRAGQAQPSPSLRSHLATTATSSVMPSVIAAQVLCVPLAPSPTLLALDAIWAGSIYLPYNQPTNIPNDQGRDTTGLAGGAEGAKSATSRSPAILVIDTSTIAQTRAVTRTEASKTDDSLVKQAFGEAGTGSSPKEEEGENGQRARGCEKP